MNETIVSINIKFTSFQREELITLLLYHETRGHASQFCLMFFSKKRPLGLKNNNEFLSLKRLFGNLLSLQDERLFYFYINNFDLTFNIFFHQIDEKVVTELFEYLYLKINWLSLWHRLSYH